MSVKWRIRLARQAEADMSDILQWTARHFGPAQAEHYAQTVIAAIEALGDGPDIVGVRMRSDIALNVRTLHVARQGRKGPLRGFSGGRCARHRSAARAARQHGFGAAYSSSAVCRFSLNGHAPITIEDAMTI